MLRGIVGVRVSISDVQAKNKLSQNKSDADREAVVEALKLRGATDLACAMQAQRDKDRS